MQNAHKAEYGVAPSKPKSRVKLVVLLKFMSRYSPLKAVTKQ